MSKHTIKELLSQKQEEELKQFLLSHANLPGRRMNLTIIAEFADSLGDVPDLPQWQAFLTSLLQLTPEADEPETILSCSGIETLGGIYFLVSADWQQEIKQHLKLRLNSQNWREREIVTEAYKRIGLADYATMVRLFKEILNASPTLLERRGIIATLAHPVLLKTTAQQDFALKICAEFFAHYLENNLSQQKSSELTAYEKGLAFAPSVIVASSPSLGFELVNNYLGKDQKLTKLIITNLKKARLAKKFPNQVNQLLINDQ